MATPQGNDTVYVAGLPDVVTEKDIAAHFGSIGHVEAGQEAAMRQDLAVP
jgi:RNA recognition motif-containing protein